MQPTLTRRQSQTDREDYKRAALAVRRALFVLHAIVPNTLKEREAHAVRIAALETVAAELEGKT